MTDRKPVSPSRWLRRHLALRRHALDRRWDTMSPKARAGKRRRGSRYMRKKRARIASIVARWAEPSPYMIAKIARICNAPTTP